MMYLTENPSMHSLVGSPSSTFVSSLPISHLSCTNLGTHALSQTYVKPEVVRIIVGNKVDKEFSRQVSPADGKAFAERQGALFVEASAKTAVGVREAFEDVVKQTIDTPALWESGSSAGTGSATGAAKGVGKDKMTARTSSGKPMPGNITLTEDNWEEESSSGCAC
jgi:Ras-related protein Rab-18